MGIIILTKGFLLGIKSNENEKKKRKRGRSVSECRFILRSKSSAATAMEDKATENGRAEAGLC